MIIQGDARHIPLADESVQLCVTSPPYWGLRDYGLQPSIWEHPDALAYRRETGDMRVLCEHEWGNEKHVPCGNAPSVKSTLNNGWGPRPGDKYEASQNKQASQGQFCQSCGAWRGCLGLEPTPELYVQHIVQVFHEVWRVLRGDGVAYLNLGDSYASSTKGSGGLTAKQLTNAGSYHKSAQLHHGLKEKDLVGIPWRVALALQADGWWLRQDIIWAKGCSGDYRGGSVMPESVRDRCTKGHEYVFMLTKSKRYYYDAEAIKEPVAEVSLKRAEYGWNCDRPSTKNASLNNNGIHTEKMGQRFVNPSGRNRRSVWVISPQGYSGAHFATFPPKLVTPMVKAGTSEHGACPKCGKAWVRVVASCKIHISDSPRYSGCSLRNDSNDKRMATQSTTLGWRPDCTCYDDRYLADMPQAKSARKRYQRMASGNWWRRVRKHPIDDALRWPTKPCVVLDPFSGAGTTGLVCQRLGRSFVGIELNREYIVMANERIDSDRLPLFD